jgi:hypothetical protein
MPAREIERKPLSGVTDTDAAAKRVAEQNRKDKGKARVGRNAANGRRASDSSALKERLNRALEPDSSEQRRQPKVVTDPSMKPGDISPPTLGFRKYAAPTEASASKGKDANKSPTPKTTRARSGGTGMEGSPETVKITKGKTPDKPSSKPPPSKRKTTDSKTAKFVSKNVPMPPRRAPKTETPKPTGRESSPENASKKKYAKAGTGIFDRLDRALGGKGKADYTYDMPGDKYAKGGMVKRMKDSTTANGKMAKPARLKKATKKQTMACGGAVKKR